jgi:23S rRNA (adenine1618-N6)-methyltransferase
MDKPPNLHPRNPHQGRYDFSALQAIHSPLKPFVHRSAYDQWTIDFGDPAAVLALNTALLKQYYSVEDWSIPEGYLCPPIPGRADYIHHAADLLASTHGGKVPHGSRVTCLDIGTGASIVYPIIGIQTFGWSFGASDIDEQALACAKKIQKGNSFLKNQLKIIKQSNKEHFFQGIISGTNYIDLTICNPPFYGSAAEAQRATQRKQGNLRQKRNPNRRNFGGQAHELWYAGGERAFISQMIQESAAFAKNVCWFSSLVAQENHLPKLQKELEKLPVTDVRIINMGQGNKRSRILAWTFLTPKQQKAWAAYRWA